MERLLRGMFQVGQNPDPIECLKNWQQFDLSGVEVSEDTDIKILGYLNQFFTDLSAPPAIELIREYFEKQDMIEVTDRLGEITKAQVYIQANYIAILTSIKESQRRKSIDRLFRDASAIMNNGVRTKKETLKGPDQALVYLQDQMKLINEKHVKDPFDFIAWDSLDTPATPNKYLLKHFRFTKGRPIVIGGYVGIAKTFLAIDLALAVASGQSTAWGDLDVSLKGPVIHLDFEMGKNALLDRYQRMAWSRNLKLNQLELSISCFPKMYLSTKGMEVELERACKGKAMCIIDSFAASTVGKIEENNSQIAQYMNMLGRISDKTECLIVVIHHERKAKEGDSEGNDLDDIQNLRGSSAIAAALGAAVSVRKMKKDGSYCIKQSKVSSGKAGTPVYLNLSDEGIYREAYENTQGIRLETARVEEIMTPEESLKQKVIDLIRINPGIGRDDLSSKMRQAGIKISNQNLKDTTDALVESGHLTKLPRGWKVLEAKDLL